MLQLAFELLKTTEGGMAYCCASSAQGHVLAEVVMRNMTATFKHVEYSTSCRS
jgi:hypothetical protein